MKIAFYPLELFSPNLYTYRVCEAIHFADPSIEIVPLLFSIRKMFFALKNVDLFWLNWYENISNASKIYFVKLLIAKWLFFIGMKFCRKKVVVVFHNKRPHEMLFKRISLCFFKFILNYSDKIIVLCDDSIPFINSFVGKDLSYKICKILHPCYICSPKRYDDKPKDEFRILFAGQLRPYKNIELLLEIAQNHPEFDFMISGKPISEEYAKFLLNEVRQLPNVELELKFNSDSEFEALMENASLLVLPYHLQSSLNSGVAMYAFSKGINVVMPVIGTVTELIHKDLVFAYTYADKKEHYEKLENKIVEAFAEYQNNYKDFIHRAEVIRKEVLERCSIQAIGNQIKFSGLMDITSM